MRTQRQNHRCLSLKLFIGELYDKNTALSLYSRTRTHSPWTLALVYTPLRPFCIGKTKMLVSKKPLGHNANQNTSRWNIVCVGQFCVGIVLVMSISCCLFPVSLSWVANFWWNMGFMCYECVASSTYLMTLCLDRQGHCRRHLDQWANIGQPVHVCIHIIIPLSNSLHAPNKLHQDVLQRNSATVVVLSRPFLCRPIYLNIYYIRSNNSIDSLHNL